MPRRAHKTTESQGTAAKPAKIKWTTARKDLLITFIETNECFYNNQAEGGTDPDFKDSLVLDFTTNILQMGPEYGMYLSLKFHGII